MRQQKDELAQDSLRPTQKGLKERKTHPIQQMQMNVS